MFDLMNRNRSAEVYNPFREMENFERSALRNFFSSGDLAEFKTDVQDKGDHYLLEADLPGFEKKDIRLDVQGDVLTIRAERRSEFEKKDEKNRFLCAERSYGSYARQFNLGGVDADRIRAQYENGVLRLTLPKKEERLPESRRLEIE